MGSALKPMGRSTNRIFNWIIFCPIQFATHSNLTKLVFNHVDAWALTLIIVIFALLIHDAITFRNLLLAVAISLGYWLAFALNDYYDAPYDAQEPKKAERNFFVQLQTLSSSEGVLSPLPQQLFWLIWWGTCTFLIFAFAQYGLRGLTILIVCFIVMWAYSAPPLRLKSRPGLDLLTHAIFVETFPYLITLILIDVVWLKLDYILLTLAILSSLAAQLEQQIRDFDVDSRTDKNFTTTIGLPISTTLLKIVTIVGVTLFLYFSITRQIPLWISGFLFLGIPIAVHRLMRPPDAPRSEKLTFILVVTCLIYSAVLFIYTIS